MTLLVGTIRRQPAASRPAARVLGGRASRWFAIHAGDSQRILKGNRLDEVAGLVMKNILFVPGKLSTSADG